MSLLPLCSATGSTFSSSATTIPPVQWFCAPNFSPNRGGAPLTFRREAASGQSRVSTARISVARCGSRKGAALPRTGSGRAQYSWRTRPDGEEGATVVSTEDLVLGFANTHGHLGRLPERFADSAGLRDWLSQQQVDPSALVITGADVIEAREIRDALVTVMVSHADTEAASADELLVAEQALQRAAQRYPLQANITREGAGLSSVQPGLAGVIGSVLASVVELAHSGQWNRFKACATAITVSSIKAATP